MFHDDDLRRMLDRPERVADLSYRALRSLRLRRDTFIPTLAEAFEACGPDLLVNVELKSEGLFDRAVPPLVDRVAELVAALEVGPRVLVSSFDPRAVWLWRRRCPAMPGALLCETEDPFAAAARRWPCRCCRRRRCTRRSALCRPALVERWHRAGYLVNTWTVDDPARLRALAAMGVDGVICNDPAAARGAALAVADLILVVGDHVDGALLDLRLQQQRHHLGRGGHQGDGQVVGVQVLA